MLTTCQILTLAGVVKDVLLVLLSVIIFGSPVTAIQCGGYALALAGLNLHKEYKKNPEKTCSAVTQYVTNILGIFITDATFKKKKDLDSTEEKRSEELNKENDSGSNIPKGEVELSTKDITSSASDPNNAASKA